MKKLLLAIGFIFFAGFTHAATLTGIVTDNDTRKPISEIKVEVDGKNSTTKENGVYKIRGFEPSNKLKITFKHKDYQTATGQFTTEGGRYYIRLKNDDNSDDATYEKQEIIKVGENYTLNVKLKKIIPIVEIIHGTITAEKEGYPEEILRENLSITIAGPDSENFPNPDIFMTPSAEYGYTYVIEGYLGTAKIPRNYRVGFKYTPYETVFRDFEVHDKILDKNR